MNEIYDKMGEASEEEMDALYGRDWEPFRICSTPHDFYMIDCKVEEVARALRTYWIWVLTATLPI